MHDVWREWLDGMGLHLTREPSVILPSVSAVLLDADRQVLLDQRADNHGWGLPGGAVDIGEPVLETLRREVTEETGYVIDPTLAWLTGIYSDPHAYACSTYKDRTIHYVNLTFAMTYHPTQQPIWSRESLMVAWYKLSALPEGLMPSHAQRLQDAVALLAGNRRYPAVR